MLTLRTRAIAVTAAAIMASATFGATSAFAAGRQATGAAYEADLCNDGIITYTAVVTGENQNGYWLTSPAVNVEPGRCWLVANWWWEPTPAVTFYSSSTYAQANSCSQVYIDGGPWECAFPNPNLS
jgi:hypothetical protein